MIKLQGCVDQNYMVLGLGRSGMASAGALTASGANVICYDDDDDDNDNDAWAWPRHDDILGNKCKVV